MQTFKVTNFKGIRGTVEVSADGGSVIVSGKNEAGKSSFLDGIMELFDARGIRFTPHPINHNADEAEAEFIDTVRDVRIVRTWKRDKHGDAKTTFSVYALDGAKHAKPSEVVADLIGGIIFDPSRFLLLDPKPQRDMLLRKVELPFDLEQLEGRERAAEEVRLQRGQAARAAEGAVTNADRPAPGTPEHPVSTSELVAELQAAQEHNRRRDAVGNSLDNLGRETGELDAQIKSLEAQLQRMKQKHSEDLASLQDAVATYQSLVAIDTTELEAKVENVDEINRNVQMGENVRELENRAAVARKEWEAASAQVAMIQNEKAEGLKQAVFPHPLLSVSDDGVLFNGVPFAQVNSGQREEAAFAIATSGDPRLRLVIVKNGDLMDEDSLANIDRMATERGYTVLVERGRPDVGGLIATFVELAEGQLAA